MKNLLMLSLLATGCDEGDDTGDASIVDGELQMCGEGVPDDAVSIDSAAISEGTLSVDVGYGGGCASHEIGLCWDGSVAESNPGQVWLWLSHEANGDSCEAWLSDTLSFELALLAGSAETGALTVHLDGWSDSLAYVW